jgi:hypothetical protein
MPIELIIKIGAGALFGGLICAGLLSLIHRRAIRLTERRVESAFEQFRADKELLQTILLHARAQMIEQDERKSAFNRLSSKFDALKIELESVKAKVDSTYPVPLNEHVSLVPLAPTTGQVLQKSGLSLEGEISQPGENQFRQEDTWARDEPPNDGGESELQALLGLPEKDLIAQLNCQVDQAGRLVEKKSSS